MKFLAQYHTAGKWLESYQGFQKLDWWLNWIPFMVSPEAVIMMVNPSFSIKHFPVNPIARHPSALPMSLISNDTQESQGGKEMPNRHPPTPNSSQKIGTASLLSSAEGCISLTAAGAEEQPRRSTSPLSLGTQESASVTAHHLFCPRLKSKGTTGTHETLATPRNAA